jgi:hypothetical protein
MTSQVLTLVSIQGLPAAYLLVVDRSGFAPEDYCDATEQIWCLLEEKGTVLTEIFL